VERNLEPVYFQGLVVGHIRKFDSRLQIELLRAHLPDLFKTPGKQSTYQYRPADPRARCRDAPSAQAARDQALRRVPGRGAQTRPLGFGLCSFHLLVYNYLRRRLAERHLLAHFLQTRSKSFDLLLLLRYNRL
jgi:hypothetical protein